MCSDLHMAGSRYLRRGFCTLMLFIVLRNTSVQSYFACSVHGACNVYLAIVDMSVHVHVHAQYVVQVLYMYVHCWIIAL